MTNDAWKKLGKEAREVVMLRWNPTARWLSERMTDSGGAVSEVFLNAADGHKVAFVEKTSSYVHKGSPKFDVPFATGKPWQGKPEADQSARCYQLQVAVPVFEPAPADTKDGAQAQRTRIGVLVVGIDLAYLRQQAARPPKPAK